MQFFRDYFCTALYQQIRCAALSAETFTFQLLYQQCATDVFAVSQLIKRIKQGGLAAAFLDDSARFAPYLETFPLFLVTNEQVGLLGAREYAIKLLRSPDQASKMNV